MSARRRFVGLVCAATCALVACTVAPQAGRAPDDAKRRASSAPRQAASTVPGAGRSPVASPGPAGPKAPAPPSVLRRPTGAAVPLTGTVRMDASYLVAAGAGNVLGQGTGQIVAAGGLNLIGADGASLIGADGASLIGADGASLVGADGASIVAAATGNVIALGGLAAGALAPADASGNLVAAGGLNLIGADGASLVGADGASLVGADGASLVGADGASLVGADGASFRLAQAQPQPQAPTPVAGTQLPAAGLRVSVVRLSDHTYLPLGLDAAGQPVHAVYSNAQGAYEVWIPATERGNVAVVASVPGQTDARLNLNLLTEPGQGGALAVDEVSALTARYLRLGLTRRLAVSMKSPELAIGLLAFESSFVGTPSDPGKPAPVGSPYWRVTQLLAQIAAVAKEAGIPEDAPDEVWEAAAQRCVDATLGRIPLHELVIRSEDLREKAGDGQSVVAALDEGTRVLHEGAALKLRAQPGFFTQQFLETVVNAPIKGFAEVAPIGDWAGRIRKPGDVGEFTLVEYFGAVRAGVVTPLRRLYTVFYEALGERGDQLTAKTNATVATGRAAAYTILVTFARELQGPTIGPDGTPAAPNTAFEAQLRAICADVATRHRSR